MIETSILSETASRYRRNTLAISVAGIALKLIPSAQGSDVTVFGVDVGAHIWWVGFLFLFYQSIIYGFTAFLEFSSWLDTHDSIKAYFFVFLLGRSKDTSVDDGSIVVKKRTFLSRYDGRVEILTQSLDSQERVQNASSSVFSVVEFRSLRFSFWRFALFDVLISGILIILALTIAVREIIWYFYYL